MSDFDISVERPQDDVALVRVSGFLDAHTFEQMDQTFEEMFGEGCHRIAVDMSGVDYISSAGAGVFIGAVDTAQENGGDVVLMKLTEPVREIFELLGLTSILTFEDDEDKALAALSG